jgi:hypothetical protein
MATAYKSTEVTAGYPVPAPMTGGVAEVVGHFVQTAAFVINDTVAMVTVPNGYQVTDVILDTQQLDTNGSPTITLDVGDATTPQAYIAASTIGQTGGVVHAAVGGYTNNTPYAIATSGGNAGSTNVIVKVHAAPATGTTTAKMNLVVRYVQDPRQAAASFS